LRKFTAEKQWKPGPKVKNEERKKKGKNWDWAIISVQTVQEKNLMREPGPAV
jgi:hypothetical protein